MPASYIISHLEVPISQSTLRNWANTGQIRIKRSPGGKRFYHFDDVKSKVGEAPIISHRVTGRTVGYARVNSSNQKEDLRRQEEYIKQRYPACTDIITDIGSTLDYNRRGFSTLLSSVEKGDVSTVVVTYRDRLCRFGIELVERIFRKSHTELVVLCLEDSNHSELQESNYGEIANDLIDVCNYFVTKRNAKYRKERREHTNQEVQIVSKQGNGQNSQTVVPHHQMGIQSVCGVVIVEQRDETNT